MKQFIYIRISLIALLFAIICSCNKTTSEKKHTSDDSLKLIKMVRERENAMKEKNITIIMSQFADDATFINSAGYFFANKKEKELFHRYLSQNDSISYYYFAGDISIRFLDEKNALVYYPWRMDWFNVSNPKDTLKKEVGLMTLNAQKRENKWLWVAITNEHTPDFFQNLEKHKVK